MKIGVYPGTFDPITNGHIDIIDRACRMFDKVVVAIANDSSKQSLFSVEERVELMEQVLAERSKAEVDTFSGLLVEYVQKREAVAVIRGLRAVTDFDYEYAMYQMNQDLDENIDTIFLLAVKEYSFLSSSILKEVSRFGREVSKYTPSLVNEALLKKYGH